MVLQNIYQARTVFSNAFLNDLHYVDALDAVYPARVLLQGMVLFKECLSQWAPTRKANVLNPDSGTYLHAYLILL